MQCIDGTAEHQKGNGQPNKSVRNHGIACEVQMKAYKSFLKEISKKYKRKIILCQSRQL